METIVVLKILVIFLGILSFLTGVTCSYLSFVFINFHKSKQFIYKFMVFWGISYSIASAFYIIKITHTLF